MSRTSCFALERRKGIKEAVEGIFRVFPQKLCHLLRFEICSVFPASFKSKDGRSFILRLYLTVEQIRYAASVWVAVQSFPPSVQMQAYRQASEIIQYHQKYNQQAREYHARRKRQKLRALGIHVEKLRCCIQDNS